METMFLSSLLTDEVELKMRIGGKIIQQYCLYRGNRSLKMGYQKSVFISIGFTFWGEVVFVIDEEPCFLLVALNEV